MIWFFQYLFYTSIVHSCFTNRKWWEELEIFAHKVLIIFSFGQISNYQATGASLIRCVGEVCLHNLIYIFFFFFHFHFFFVYHRLRQSWNVSEMGRLFLCCKSVFWEVSKRWGKCNGIENGNGCSSHVCVWSSLSSFTTKLSKMSIDFTNYFFFIFYRLTNWYDFVRRSNRSFHFPVSFHFILLWWCCGGFGIPNNHSFSHNLCSYRVMTSRRIALHAETFIRHRVRSNAFKKTSTRTKWTIERLNRNVWIQLGEP